MEHRHMIPMYYQHDTNYPPVAQTHIPMARGVAIENGHFVTPMDHTIRGVDHSNSHCHFGFRSNEYHNHSLNMNMETQTQHLHPHLSRPPFDPHTPTPSTNGNTSFTHVGHITHNISESGGQHKRKTPGSFSNTLYGAESSSSSQIPIQNPDSYRGSNLLINGQDSIRNVRTRFEPELEPCWTGAHVQNYASSQYYQPITHSVNYSAPVHPVNLGTDVMGQERNIIPSYHGSISHPDLNQPRSETSQFFAGMSSVDINASRQNPFTRENLASSSSSSSQNHQHVQSYHHQRVTPFYRYNIYNDPYTGSSSTQFPSENLSSRYYAPAGGHVTRPMVAVERPQPLFGHQILNVEHPSLYHEDVNIPDPYQDMRLDIDNMTYEELLALEERIGYVSHGLSEDGMSKCLRERIYSSLDQNYDHCPICLEEYKNGERIGRIGKCGHEYHVDCIKKWMVMKKACPICKTEC